MTRWLKGRVSVRRLFLVGVGLWGASLFVHGALGGTLFLGALGLWVWDFCLDVREVRRG